MSGGSASELEDLPGRAVPAMAEHLPAAADWSRRDPSLQERLDGPLTYQEWLAASRDIARINRWTLAYKPAIAFLERVVARRGVGYEPLVVVDAGCGYGDGVRHVARWAAQRSVPVRLIGIDLHPYAARAARQRARDLCLPAGIMEWRTADIFTAEFDAQPDVVLSSLFTHHLQDAEIARFLQWSEAHARWGWLVNDLRRSQRAYQLFGLASRCLRLHPLVRHDGLLSIRRAFTAEDWQVLLKAAGIEGVSAKAVGTRLCVERLKDALHGPV